MNQDNNLKKSAENQDVLVGEEKAHILSSLLYLLPLAGLILYFLPVSSFDGRLFRGALKVRPKSDLYIGFLYGWHSAFLTVLLVGVIS